MAQIGSYSQAVRLVEASAARAVPHVLEERNIFTKHLFPTISSFFDVSSVKLAPGQVKIKAPGSIESRVTHHMSPKAYGFGTLPTSFEIATGYNALTADTDGTVVLTTTSHGLKKYALLNNRVTKATVQVRSVSGATITIRGAGGGSAGNGLDAASAGQMLDFVGYALPDGATLVDGNKHEPSEWSNYIQFHVTETDIGILAEKRKLFPDMGNSGETDWLINFIQHNEGRERAFLFGQSVYQTIGNELITAMKGFDGWSDSEFDVGGTLTMDALRQVVGPIIFNGGGGVTKKGVTGNTVLSVFDGLMDKMTTYQKPVTSHDVNFREFSMSSGRIRLEGSQPMTEREGEVWFYNPDLLIRYHFEGLDATVFTDLAPNNILKSTKAIMTAETLIPRLPEDIVKITGILN